MAHMSSAPRRILLIAASVSAIYTIVSFSGHPMVSLPDGLPREAVSVVTSPPHDESAEENVIAPESLPYRRLAEEEEEEEDAVAAAPVLLNDITEEGAIAAVSGLLENETISVSDNCELKRGFMPEGSMPVILLLSYPGSGNTWVRYLLERSSGIYSGSVYNDKGTGDSEDSIFRRSNPCSGTIIVVKTHGHANPHVALPECENDGAIFLIRNPYNAFLSEFNRRNGGKTGFASKSQFRKSWKKYIKGRAEKWVTSAATDLPLVKNRLIVYYENLVEDTEHELRRMLSFLGVTQDENRIRCLLQNTTGHFKRKHKKQSTAELYSRTMNTTIDGQIRALRKIMAKYNITLPEYESFHPKYT